METGVKEAAAPYEPLFITRSREDVVLEFGVTPDGRYIIAGDGKILAQYPTDDDADQLPLAMRAFDRLRRAIRA